MTREELNAVVRDLREVRAMIKELEAEEEALTDKVKMEMIDQGVEVLTGDEWKASWKNVNNSRFDSKKFKEEHADMYAAYSKSTTTTRFLLTI